MAGSTADFGATEAAEFIREVTGVMVMGLPNDEADKPTFYWETVKTYAKASVDGRPLNWDSAASTSTLRDPVQAICAVELLDAAGNPVETPVGDFNADQARLTFFADEYAKVADFDWVTLGESKYLWSKRLPTLGLGPADIIQVVVSAADES